jgi:hypothetical protein
MPSPILRVSGINNITAAISSEAIKVFAAMPSRAGGTKRYPSMAVWNAEGSLSLCMAEVANSSDMQIAIIVVMTGSMSMMRFALRCAHDGWSETQLIYTTKKVSFAGIVDIQNWITNKNGKQQRSFILAYLYGCGQIIEFDLSQLFA